MKRVIILSMIVAALVMALPGLALAAGTTPQDIYNDYAKDKQLDGTYTDAQLEAFLKDANSQQYADEQTITELETLIRTRLNKGRSEFPFTGLEMALVAVGALVLIGGGVILRKTTR